MLNLILAIILGSAPWAALAVGGLRWQQNSDWNFIVQLSDGRTSQIPWSEWRQSAPTGVLVEGVEHGGHAYLIVQPDGRHIQSWEDDADQIGTLVVRDDLKWQRLPGRGYKFDKGHLATPSSRFDLAEFQLRASNQSQLLDQIWDGMFPTQADLKGGRAKACRRSHLSLFKK